MDVISYALSKKIAEHAVSGVQSMSVSGQTLTINTKDSGVLTMTFPVPKDGVSVTDIDVNANNQIVFTMSDGTEFISGEIPTVKGDKGDPFKYSDFTQEQLDSLKGSDGFSPSAKVEKVGDTATITITDKDGTTTATIKDGQGGSGGTVDVPIEKIKVNGELQTPVNKVVDITVPSIGGLTKDADLATVAKSGSYEDLSNKPEIPSLDGYAKTSEIPSKVSELENDSNYLSSIPEEYVTETELSAKGYLTEHQDISGKVDKVDGKSLIADTEIERLASVDNYDDTQVKTQIQAVANGLMDSVGYSADYKSIDIIAKNGVKKSVNVAPIISHASITELSDVDTTNKATGKALVYNATTSKHEYADVSGTDEKVKMDASTDAKYLGELLDNVTIANENGKLKVKKLDGQEVTITEINYLKGLTMNVMDLVNMFSNGGVKIINTPVATYAELLTLDKSSFIEGISYLVYVLADENHDNAKTTYLVDKDSETPTYFGFADSHRDFTTNPIDLATEITGKLGIANMDSDAIKALFTVDDTYKTETATNNAFSTHGAKALYDELLLAIGNKANDSDLTAHKDDTDIHVSTEDRTKWDSAKTHADSAHAPSNAQENVLETVKVNGTALEVSDKAVNVTVPTKVSELTDSADYAKIADVNDSISTLQTDKADASDLTAHTDDTDIHVTAENKATWNTVSDKVDKEDGKGLSANDYTNEEKALVGTIKDKINKTSIVTTLNDSVTDEQVASALLAKTELDKKIDKTSIVTNISAIPSDENVMSEKAISNLVSNYAEHDEIVGENLIPYPYAQPERTTNGITFTFADDGSVIANGTATADADFSVSVRTNFGTDKAFMLKPGTYAITGCPEGGSDSTYRIHVQFGDKSGVKYNLKADYGKGFVFEVTEEHAQYACQIQCHVQKGYTVTDLVFKPMLVLGSVLKEYQPYNLSRNALRTDIDNVNSKVDNQFSTAIGDYITVTDSVDGKLVELGVKGNSFQNSYTGKNILHNVLNPTYNYTGTDGSTITTTVDGDVITVTNTEKTGGGFSNHYAWIWTSREENLIDISKYVGQKLTFSIDVISGSMTQRWLGFMVSSYKNTTDTSTSIKYLYNSPSSLPTAGLYNCGTLEVTQDFIDTNGKYIGVNYWISNNNIHTNFKFRTQIEVGDTATEYEPYVGGIPVPNPLYPQAINSVGDDGSLVVKSCGKNLIPFPYYQKSGELNGVTWTVNDDGTVIANGTATKETSFNYINPFSSLTRNKLIPNQTYTFFDGINGKINGVYTQVVRYNIKSNSYEWSLSSYKNRTFTTTNENLLTFGYRTVIDAGITVNNLILKPQLEIGTNTTDFNKYESFTTTIPLSEPLRAIGDIKDEITYQDGKWGVLRRTGKHVIDGTENFILDSDHIVDCGISVRLGGYTNTLKGISSVTGNTKDMITDYLRCIEYETIPYYATSNSVQEDKGSGTYRTPGNIWISFGASDIEKMGITKDIDSVKEWLSNHNITFIYPLGTPTFTPFADQTLPYISTYDGVTNISNDDALSAEMTVKYPITDASGVGSRNESRIADIEKNKVDKSSVITSLNSDSTDKQVPSAKAVYDKYKETIYNNEDLDLITETGLYVCIGGDTYGATYHFPVLDNGYLYHANFPAEGYCTQIFIPNGVWGGDLSQYIRRQKGGTWTNWVRNCNTTVADTDWTDCTLQGDFTGFVKYRVKNGICFVWVSDFSSDTIMSSGNQLVCTGLPKHDLSADTYWGLVTNSLAPFDSLILNVNSSQELRTHVGINSAKYFGSFSYPVAES